MSDAQLFEVDRDGPDTEIDDASTCAPVKTSGESGDIEAVDGPACEKCGTSMGDSQVSYCLGCGYYPSMGTYVEIDAWEKALTGQSEAKPEELSHIQVWINLLPAWGWQLIGCHLAVVGVSIAVRLVSPAEAESVFRMAWSVSQLFIGFLVFFACHLLAYLAAIEGNAEFSLLDFFLRPFKIWAPTVRKLPASFQQFAGGTCGLNAALMSVLVIGALPYHMLWDWGIKERPKHNLVGAILAQAMEAEGNEDGLEDAIGDFAGAADADAAAKEALEARREPADCLIVGYTTSKDGKEIASLILAREFQGKLKLIGRVSTGLEDETRIEYLEKLKEIARPTPFIQTVISANWVDPVYTCRVTCKSQSATGRLADMQYDRMLGSVE